MICCLPVVCQVERSELVDVGGHNGNMTLRVPYDVIWAAQRQISWLDVDPAGLAGAVTPQTSDSIQGLNEGLGL